jgi:hypothetical protein
LAVSFSALSASPRFSFLYAVVLTLFPVALDALVMLGVDAALDGPLPPFW